MGDREAVAALNRLGQQSHDDGEQQHEGEVGRVGRHDPQLAPHEGRDLPEHGLLLGRLLLRRRSRGRCGSPSAPSRGHRGLHVLTQLRGVVADEGVDIGVAVHGGRVGQGSLRRVEQQAALRGDLVEPLAEVGEYLAGGAVVDGLASRSQDEDLVRAVDVVLVVGDDDDRAAAVTGTRPMSQGRQQVHDVTVQLGVQAGGGLVEEQEAGACQQLDGGGDPLALASGELLDPLVHVRGQVKILQDLGDALAPLGLGHVLGEAQLSGVLEGLADSEGRVDDVALGDHTDLVAHDRVVLVHVQPVEEHLALLGLLLAGEGLEQRRLPGSRRADDGQQLVARQGEGDAVEQRHAAVVDPEGQVLTHQLAAGSAGDLDLAQTVRAQGDEGRSQTYQHGLGDLDL